MPRIKSWLSRIPLILQHLDTSPTSVYTNIDVQRLFIIKRVSATDLMKIAGSTVRNGSEATVSRENLKYYVERCPEAAVYMAEEARKEKQARQIREGAAASERALRFGAMIADRAKPRDQFTDFEEVKGLSIEPGKLTLLFADARDLAHKLFQLAHAEERDPEEFWKLCEPPAPPRAPRPVRFSPLSHAFTAHRTYTGTGCAMCGQPEAAHLDCSGCLRLATPEEAARILSDTA